MTVDVIVPAYKPITLDRCLASVSSCKSVNITVISDNSPHHAELKKICEGHGGTFYNAKFATSVYRKCTVLDIAIKKTIGDIIGIVDDDMILEDGYIDKVINVLSNYKNILVWGACTLDREEMMETFSPKEHVPRFHLRTHKDIMWSTTDNPKIQWHGLYADGAVFVRRDFVEPIGGFPNTSGYGYYGENICRKFVSNGGVSCLFSDLNYFHVDHHPISNKKFIKELEYPEVDLANYRDVNKLIKMEDCSCFSNNWRYSMFNLPEKAYRWIRSNIPDCSIILELGSGKVTQELSKTYQMISIENDINYVGLYDSKYVYAPILNGWYNIKDIENSGIPSTYALLLIDGPAQSFGSRLKFLDHSDLFNLECTILVADVNRPDEKLLLEGLSERVNRKYEIYEDSERMFGVIRQAEKV